MIVIDCQANWSATQWNCSSNTSKHNADIVYVVIYIIYGSGSVLLKHYIVEKGIPILQYRSVQ